MAVDLSTRVPVRLGALPDRPLVSVLMASYNHERYVGAAIEGVLGQTYDHLELVVCDDASPDRSREVIRQYCGDRRVRFATREHGGENAAVSEAYTYARGEVVTFLDSDDLYEPHRLEVVVAALRDGRHGFLVHPARVIDGSGRGSGITPRAGVLGGGWLRARVLQTGGGHPQVVSSAMAFRRELAEHVFPIPAGVCPDKFGCALLALLTPVAAVDAPLSCYRFHGANPTARRTRLTVPSLDDMIGDWEALGRELPGRLRARGVADPGLDLERNVHLREQRFRRLAIAPGGSTGELARAWPRLARDCLADPRLSRLRRVRAVAAYGLAAVLPRGPRVLVMRAAFRWPSARQVLQGARRVLRGEPRCAT